MYVDSEPCGSAGVLGFWESFNRTFDEEGPDGRKMGAADGGVDLGDKGAVANATGRVRGRSN